MRAGWWAVMVATALAAAGCGSSSSSSAPTTTTIPVGTLGSTTTVAPTTTVPAVPPAPQASADDAADAFIRGWQSGNRSYSASVATSTAVATLFAHPYAGQTVESRGCTTSFPPYVCSYGPPGGANSGNALYQVNLAQTGGRWYVSSVTIEG